MTEVYTYYHCDSGKSVPTNSIDDTIEVLKDIEKVAERMGGTALKNAIHTTCDFLQLYVRTLVQIQENQFRGALSDRNI